MLPRALRACAVAFALAMSAFSATAFAQELTLPRATSWNILPDTVGGSTLGEVYFADMPPGWHLATGPAAILWDPANRVEGTFRVEMEVYLFDPGTRREPFGIFVGGRDLTGPAREYLSFVVRDGGEYAVGQRMGSNSRTLIGWTRHPAIVSWSDRPEGEVTARNVLVVEASEGEVRFLANGREIVALVRDALPPLDGIVGIRASEALELHVSRLEVSEGRF